MDKFKYLCSQQQLADTGGISLARTPFFESIQHRSIATDSRVKHLQVPLYAGISHDTLALVSDIKRALWKLAAGCNKKKSALPERRRAGQMFRARCCKSCLRDTRVRWRVLKSVAVVFGMSKYLDLHAVFFPFFLVMWASLNPGSVIFTRNLKHSQMYHRLNVTNSTTWWSDLFALLQLCVQIT